VKRGGSIQVRKFTLLVPLFFFLLILINSSSGLNGVRICEVNYNCGVADNVCPEHFCEGENCICSLKDPDCDNEPPVIQCNTTASGSWIQNNAYFTCNNCEGECLITNHCASTGSGICNPPPVQQHVWSNPVNLQTSPLSGSTGDSRYLTLETNDDANNWENLSFTYKIDADAPTTTITPVGATVTITCDDAGGSGCDYIQYCIQTSAVGDCTGQSLMTYNGPFSLTENAYVYARSTDNVGFVGPYADSGLISVIGCNQHSTSGECTGNGCEWCSNCGTNNQQRIGGEVCVDPGTCNDNYQCVNETCGADCSIGDCGPYLSGNTCFYDSDCTAANSCGCTDYSSEECHSLGIDGDSCYYSSTGSRICENTNGCNVQEDIVYADCLTEGETAGSRCYRTPQQDYCTGNEPGWTCSDSTDFTTCNQNAQCDSELCGTCIFSGGDWVWGSTSELSETCILAQGIDEDCDGETDYDTQGDGIHGDDNCSVAITWVIPDETAPCFGQPVDVWCRTDVANVNSVKAYIDPTSGDQSPCIFQEWETGYPPRARFSCPLFAPGVSHEIRCYIDESRSYATGTGWKNAYVIPTSCDTCAGQEETPCDVDPLCEWCPTCSDLEYSGFVAGACVPTGNCNYQCAYGQCGAACSDDGTGCDDYELSGNLCLSNPSCSATCGDCNYGMSTDCPPAGTIIGDMCYYGETRGCTGSQPCSLSSQDRTGLDCRWGNVIDGAFCYRGEEPNDCSPILGWADCNADPLECTVDWECNAYPDQCNGNECVFKNNQQYAWVDNDAIQSETACDDGHDNDCDGLTDGEDPDCNCVPPGDPEVCTDYEDNDCDTLIDYEDFIDCRGTLSFVPEPAAIAGTVQFSVPDYTQAHIITIKDYRGCTDPGALTVCSYDKGIGETYCEGTAPPTAGDFHYFACVDELGIADEFLTVQPPSCGDTGENDINTGHSSCNHCYNLNPESYTIGDQDDDQNGWTDVIADYCDNDCGIVSALVQPEDYQISEVNCTDGIDNDCNGFIDEDDPNCQAGPNNGTINGYVTNEFNNESLGTGVFITIFPPGQPSRSIEVGLLYEDYYRMDNIPVGTYYVTAQKEGYPTETRVVTIPANVLTTENFYLSRWGCNQFCGDFEGRCNMNCEGFDEGPDPEDPEGNARVCHFQTQEVMQACDGRITGTTVLLNFSGDMSTFVNCCEGTPYTIDTPPALIQGTMENIIKFSRVVTYGAQPTNIVVVTWKDSADE